MFTTTYLRDMSERYEYEQEHGDRFHDYEEDSIEGQGHWPADSYNDYEEEEPEDNTDDQYDDSYNDDYREDLGWDGGYED